MSGSSDSGSEGLPYASRTLSGEPVGPHAGPETPELLENVLRETLAICTSDEPLDDADMQRLRQVARRFSGRPVASEPVAAELVYAVLEGHFAVGVSVAGEFWRTAAAQIAQTLLGDPGAKARLERLWTRLGGEAS
jgi:hypothetical protein